MEETSNCPALAWLGTCYDYSHFENLPEIVTGPGQSVEWKSIKFTLELTFHGWKLTVDCIESTLAVPRANTTQCRVFSSARNDKVQGDGGNIYLNCRPLTSYTLLLCSCSMDINA